MEEAYLALHDERAKLKCSGHSSHSLTLAPARLLIPVAVNRTLAATSSRCCFERQWMIEWDT